ncbi:MAG: DUF1592 domain-containing protein [Acidobacteria bacterium]|nr:DUF1592 domain-containing protein [Acidobacteriota bacterium]
MISITRRLRLRTAGSLLLLTLAGTVWTTRLLWGQSAESPAAPLEASFENDVKPFLAKNCAACHNADTMTAGVRVDDLDASLPDRTVKVWEGIRRRVSNGSMPPKGLPQPDGAERQRVVGWVTQALEVAKLRPSPKNGIVRRLTVAQYRNTLRELLLLEDDLTDALPPDAISKDGFVNNTDTLQLSPLLMEAYFEIAEEALNRSIVDPDKVPSIQNFRVDLGASINPEPLPDELILGANSLLLENQDVLVTQLIPQKPFVFEPFRMRTKYRFIEGYEGNATVRGWRDFDSIYHAVFADMRGSRGYPKGLPYSTVPAGLLLRPAIPTDELFGSDGTYGPKANFKISLRELPDHGRFRVTVTAAKYDDGLLLDPGASPRDPAAAGAIVSNEPTKRQSLRIPQAGVYQVDIHVGERGKKQGDPDSSRLSEALGGYWALDGEAPGALEGEAKFVESPFGQAVSLNGNGDAVAIPHDAALDVGEGDFTVAAWIRPKQLRKAGIIAVGGKDWAQGWRLEMPDNKGGLQLVTTGPGDQANGSIASPAGVILDDAWQHVAAVVKRGTKESRLYINGYAVAKGEIKAADLSNPNIALYLGRIPEANQFRGELDEVRLYRRALDEAELQALVEPGRRFALPPPEEPQTVTLQLGDRSFSGKLEQPAFVAVRLEAGELPVQALYDGMRDLEQVTLTPLSASDPLTARLRAFEKRAPRVGVHLGLRRDCGGTFAPVQEPQTVSSLEPEKFVFEGAIANYPSPDVEKDNVNYLAGIREIAVRSEYTDGRDMPRLMVKSVEFEGPLYETWPPRAHQSIFIESEHKDDPPAYAREIIRSFATRAYRRPVTEAEEAALFRVFEESYAEGGDFRQSVKDALLVALTSPQFLFLIETSSTPDPEPLTDYELASKLSYFLWNGPPDEKTLKLAAAGKLRENLDAEVSRMVGDARFSQFTREFVAQWLSLEKFDVVEPDRERYPGLTRAARAQLRKEPIEYFQYLIRENLPVKDIITSDFVMANEVVANYYGLADEETDSGFQFVPIVSRRPELGGVITQAAIMAGLSDGRESNPVKRGAWLARKIVAEPPNDPPPNVPALSEDTTGLTLRQRLEQHRNQPGCVQCHTMIDPWGVAFEEMDAGGHRKTGEVDSHSTLPDGTEVSGAEDLKRYLSQDRIDQVAYSVLKHLMTYADGRTLTYSELNSLKQDGKRLQAGDYRMQDLLRYVVTSKLFLEK